MIRVGYARGRIGWASHVRVGTRRNEVSDDLCISVVGGGSLTVRPRDKLRSIAVMPVSMLESGIFRRTFRVSMTDSIFARSLRAHASVKKAWYVSCSWGALRRDAMFALVGMNSFVLS